jgi:hypothetical protein
MLLQILTVFALEATGGDVVTVAAATPYESVNQFAALSLYILARCGTWTNTLNGSMSIRSDPCPSPPAAV